MDKYDRSVYVDFRSKDILISGFKEIMLFFQYLYMDEKHAITVSNGLCPLELKMTPSLCLICRNMNFPQFEPTVREINFDEILAFIDCLGKMPPEEYPKRFKNRWDEIRTIATQGLDINNMM